MLGVDTNRDSERDNGGIHALELAKLWERLGKWTEEDNPVRSGTAIGRSLLRVLAVVVFVTVLGGGVSTLPSPSRAAILSQTGEEEWPMLQANSQRTGWSPIELVPPYSHKWTWIPPNEDILPTVNQPVTGDGRVYIGSYTGVMYAIHESTGQTAWSYQTGGGIMHTAAFYNSRVYFTSLDFSVYCLNASNGEKVWSYETGAELVSSPLVVNDTVYVGSRDGHFYALRADTGALKWKFETEGPIDHSAAYSPSRDVVIFGSEDMYVYALEDVGNQGNLKWKSEKLYGQMFGRSWPVISEPGGLVMVRTWPTYASGDDGGIEEILCELCPEGCLDFHATAEDCDANCDYGCEYVPDYGYGCPDFSQDEYCNNSWPEIQTRIRELCRQNPYRGTFFALDLDTGEDVFADNPPAVPYIGRHADLPSYPWVDDVGNIYVHFRSASSFSRETTYGSHFNSDIGVVDPQTGDIATLITPAGSVMTSFTGMCLDDNAAFTMGGSIVYGTKSSRGGGALDLSNNRPYCIFKNQTADSDCLEHIYDAVDRRGSGYTNSGEGMNGLAISGDTLYSNRAPFGAVAAIGGTPR